MDEKEWVVVGRVWVCEFAGKGYEEVERADRYGGRRGGKGKRKKEK